MPQGMGEKLERRPDKQRRGRAGEKALQSGQKGRRRHYICRVAEDIEDTARSGEEKWQTENGDGGVAMATDASYKTGWESYAWNN